MADLVNVVSFGGIPLVSARGSFPVGRNPGQFVVETPDLAAVIPAVGTLVLSDGIRTATIPQCAVVNAELVSSVDQKRLAITMVDRRWKWKFGSIDGEYNRRSGDNTIQFPKDPQELAELCLDAMGETGYDVSALPEDPRPHVEWIATNPAEALDRLCGMFGCLIAFDGAGNVSLAVAGSGTAVPTTGLEKDISYGVDKEPLPDSIRVAGGPVQFEVWFELEPWGEETDGELKPYDDLSYKPAGGWGDVYEEFYDVTGTYVRDGKTLKKRDLARKSVWKLYKIVGIIAGTGANSLNPPGWSMTGAPDVDDLEQFLPLQNRLNKTRTTAAGKEEPFPAEVVGQWYDKHLRGDNTEEAAPYKRQWSLDTSRGFVRFSEPIYRLDGAGLREPAPMRLKCVCEVDWPGLNVKLYYARTRTGATSYGTGPAVEVQEDVLLRFTPAYNASDAVTAVNDNKSDVDAELDYYLDALELEFVGQQAASVRLSGIHTFALDGLRREIAWSMSSTDPSRTVVGLNSQANPYTPDYKTAQEEAKRRVKVSARGKRVAIEGNTPTEAGG